MKRPTCIDLFCGCGGFALGMERAGFSDGNYTSRPPREGGDPSSPKVYFLPSTVFPARCTNTLKMDSRRRGNDKWGGNCSSHGAQILEKDLSRDCGIHPRDLAALIPRTWDEVDVIMGGPPCQGFSTVCQRDGANNGSRFVEDKRRYPYQEFLRYVGFFRSNPQRVS